MWKLTVKRTVAWMCILSFSASEPVGAQQAPKELDLRDPANPALVPEREAALFACLSQNRKSEGLSANQLQERFPRPKDAQQLLANLKVAADGNWLLQPGFMNEGTLLKFFNASNLRWVNEKTLGTSQRIALAKISMDTELYSGVAVTVVAQCDPIPRSHQFPYEWRASGELYIVGTRLPGVTLAAVRGAFGTETENRKDNGGLVLHGFGDSAPPQSKGWVTYKNESDSRREGIFLGTRFAFAIGGTPHSDPSGPGVDENDEVKSISIVAAHSEILEPN